MTPDLSGPVSCVKQNDFIYNRDYEDLLRAAGLTDAAAFLDDLPGGAVRRETVKQITARSVYRLTLRHEGRERAFYLKRHNREFMGGAGLASMLFNKPPGSHGPTEFRNILDFRKAGLATAAPVAAGRRITERFWIESFFMAESFSPFVSLEDILIRTPDFFQGPDGRRRRKVLLAEIAGYGRTMHKNGFNHRDFNATHILLRYDAPSDIPQLAVFDLQRVDRNRAFRFRWPVKTLAEVLYTLPQDLFDDGDRRFFFNAYKRKTKPNALDRLQWRWIQNKTDRIARHTEKMMKKRAERRQKGLLER